MVLAWRMDGVNGKGEEGIKRLAIGAAGSGPLCRLCSRFYRGAAFRHPDQCTSGDRLYQPLRGEGFWRCEKKATTRSRHKRTAAWRHVSGMAFGQAGAKHGRVPPPLGPNPGCRRSLSQLDREFRFHHGDGGICPDHHGGGCTTRTADHGKANRSRDGSGSGAGGADWRTTQVHAREKAEGSRMGKSRHRTNNHRKAPRSVARNNSGVGEGGHAQPTNKVYCCKIPFLTTGEQHQAALDAGLPARAIYVEGRGAETFETCLASFRNGGTLGLVGGLRVLGTARKVIVERVLALKAKGVVPYDLDSGERDETKLLNDAICKINGGRALGEDPGHAKRIGAKGGSAKGAKAQERRNAIMAEEIVARLWQAKELTGRKTAEILGPPWSESTLRRKYGPKS